jgi:hypothetical protein
VQIKVRAAEENRVVRNQRKPPTNGRRGNPQVTEVLFLAQRVS